jgi:hypothetical protein
MTFTGSEGKGPQKAAIIIPIKITEAMYKPINLSLIDFA